MLSTGLLGTQGRGRCILTVGSREVPESGAGPEEEINATQMRAFNTEGKAEPKPGVGGALGADGGVCELVWPCSDGGQGSREGDKARRQGHPGWE